MSEQPEALRLAAWLDSLDVRTIDKIQNVVSSAALLRRQHARIEADEALMRTAADVLKQVESDFDGCYADCELKPVRAAITALRSRLETK